MKIYTFLLFTAVFMFSCKDNTPDIPKTTLKITVYDATAWAPTSGDTPAVGAKVIIYNEEENYEFTTDSNGNISCDKLFVYGEYLIKVVKDDLSNMITQARYENDSVGYITNGIFKNQAELDARTFYFSGNDKIYTQPDAQIGDLRFLDIDDDLKLNSHDWAHGLYYQHKPFKDINYDGIVDENDMVNGDYVLEGTASLEIWIGK